MTKQEREILISAIVHLETNPCEWEDAMSKLYALAGQTYFDHRKATGPALNLLEAAMGERK